MMNTTTTTRRAALTALTLGVLATGGGLAAAPAIAAGPAAAGIGPAAAPSPAGVAPAGTRIWQQVGPDAGPADVQPQAPATDPSGRVVQQGSTPGAQEVNGWMEVATTVEGVRIRAQPGNGTVVGTMPAEHPFYGLCTRDGWTWSHDGNREGWVRADMYGPYHRTGFPGTTDPMPGPCR